MRVPARLDVLLPDLRYAVRRLVQNPVFTIAACLSLTLGIPLVSGRDFTEREETAGPQAIVVNENFAGKYLTAGDPIGQRVVGNGGIGVIAHAVSRRTRELGIRLALGAAPRGILTLVLREAGLLAALGVIVGIPCAYVLSRAIGSLLYAVEPGDWRSLATAVIVLSSVAAVAAWVPVRRAARVDPLVALRSE